MEKCGFLDFVCQNICRASQDVHLLVGISEYIRLLISYELGVKTTEQLADGSAQIIRTIRSTEMGEWLYNKYREQKL